jgi:hypothetical protein
MTSSLSSTETERLFLRQPNELLKFSQIRIVPGDFWWCYLLVQETLKKDEHGNEYRVPTRTEIQKSQWPHQHEEYARLFGTPSKYPGTKSPELATAIVQQQQTDNNNNIDIFGNTTTTTTTTSSSSSSSVKTMAESINSVRSEPTRGTRKKPRSTQSKDTSDYKLAMIIGPFLEEHTAERFCVAWKGGTRSTGPRTGWGANLARAYGLQIFTDVGVIFGAEELNYHTIYQDMDAVLLIRKDNNSPSTDNEKSAAQRCMPRKRTRQTPRLQSSGECTKSPRRA